MTKKEQAAARRQLMSELAARKLRTRCRSLFRGHVERAKKLQKMSPNYTADELLAHVQPFIGNPCRYCGKTITIGNFALDHDIPLQRGGGFALINTAVITSNCNQRKGSLTGYEYLQLHNFAETLAPEARRDIFERLGVGGRWRRQ